MSALSLMEPLRADLAVALCALGAAGLGVFCTAAAGLAGAGAAYIACHSHAKGQTPSLCRCAMHEGQSTEQCSASALYVLKAAGSAGIMLCCQGYRAAGQTRYPTFPAPAPDKPFSYVQALCR